MWVLFTVIGCNLPEPPPARNCDSRTAFYPDEDGDGLGEPTAVYLGCEAPAGWVTILDTRLIDTDTGMGDTDTAQTGDTGSDTGS